MISNDYVTNIVEKKGIKTFFTFHEGIELPDLPISTPFTIPFLGDDVVLCLDKNGWWNPLGGHMNKGESYEQTLKREAEEEAGVSVNNIEIIGYMHAVNEGGEMTQEYPTENILPITISLVSSVNKSWIPLETKQRGRFNCNEAEALLTQREDQGQMLQIFRYARSKFLSRDYDVMFEYHSNKIFPKIPITQVFNFCRDEDYHFCLVRDKEENFYSLPGGGCLLGEEPEKCLRRELKEEAQISCDKIQLLGSVLVNFSRNGVVESSVQHLRYLSDAKDIGEFIPLKDGFETIERKFVPFSELSAQVPLLQNRTGELLLRQIEHYVV